MNSIPKDYASYLAALPIPREAAAGQLTPAEIAQITPIVFRQPNPQPADLLFVFGTSSIDKETAGQITNHFQSGYFPWILVTGMIGRVYYQTGQPLAHVMRDTFVTSDIPIDKILVQDRSTNTLEDVQFSLEILEQHRIFPKQIAFLCKAHHSGRCFLTLRRFFPEQQLWPITYDARYDGVTVSAQDWWKHPVARSRAYGEYLRIVKYSGVGDIAPIEFK